MKNVVEWGIATKQEAVYMATQAPAEARRYRRRVRFHPSGSQRRLRRSRGRYDARRDLSRRRVRVIARNASAWNERRRRSSRPRCVAPQDARRRLHWNTSLPTASSRLRLTSAGGSFTSLRANGREYLWQGDPAVWSGQAPICFPICGGLRDGAAVTASGKRIELARHGFARKQEFELIDAQDATCAYRLASKPELLEQYPFPFKLVPAIPSKASA